MKVDIWSLGVIFFILIFGIEISYNMIDNMEKNDKIIDQ